MTKRKRSHQIDVVRGVSGLAIYLNGYRIAGDKPWGGGTVVERWKAVGDEDLRKALRMSIPEEAKADK